MKPDPRTYLWDVQDAGNAILSFVSGIDADAYSDSSLIHSAVERKFEIIGEALNLLRKSHPELTDRIPDAAKIIAFRNLLIHGYAVIKHERVWAVTTESLPMLLSSVRALHDELDDASS